jgi:hypothetical protein
MTTKEQVFEIRQQYPTTSATEIARQIGVTRERVRQILNELDLPTSFELPPRYCPDCGAPILSKQIRCGQCYARAHHITLRCVHCGKVFLRLRGQVAREIRRRKHAPQRAFCSRECFDRWHKQCKGKGWKYDWDLIWQKHLETGYGTGKLSELLQIPKSTISQVLRARRNGNGQ